MGKDPDLIKIYLKNKKNYDSVKSSVKHSIIVDERKKQTKLHDEQLLTTKSHQSRKVRLLDEMMSDVQEAYEKARLDGNKVDADILLRRIKKITKDREEYIKKLQTQKDEEEEEKKKKKKKEEKPEEAEESEEEPEEEDPEKKKKKKEEEPDKKKDVYVPPISEYGGTGEKDPKKEEGEEDPEKKKKKKKKEEEPEEK